MDGTQIQEMYSEMDALVAALQNDNTDELKKLTGQGEGGGDRVGLPVSASTTIRKLRMVIRSCGATGRSWWTVSSCTHRKSRFRA